MRYWGRKSKITLIILLVVFSTTSFCNAAEASTLSDGFNTVWGFINKNIVSQVKKDFCKNYILAISTGEWKQGEFRTDLGKRVCTSYSVPANAAGEISSTAVQSLNGNLAISDTNSLSTSSINNPAPEVYSTNSGVQNSYLDINQIISLTNKERKNNDASLVNLKTNSILGKIAMIRTNDMFANQYFEHNSPTGDNASKEAAANGYAYITIGENIALGNFDGSQGLLDAWMNSPGHRANILNKNYTEIGVYATKGLYKGQTVWIATQIFGKPLSGCTEPDSVLKDKITKYKISADSILASINNIDAELKTLSQSDVSAYNAKVAERNTYAGLYNNLASEIKSSVAEYNKEVSDFNSCIKTI